MLKKLLSVVLLATVLVTSICPYMAYADEGMEETETIEGKEEGEEEKSDKDTLHEHEHVYSIGENAIHSVTCKYENCDYLEEEECELEDNKCVKCGFIKTDPESEEKTQGDIVDTKEVEIEETEKEENSECILYDTEEVVELDGIKITASGKMPENANLSVEIIDNSKEIEEKINENLSDEMKYHLYAAFDINIMVDGEKWQPVDFDELVKIKITGLDIGKAKEEIVYEPGDAIEDVTEEMVYRIENEEITELESTVNEAEVEFDTEHFTVFTVGGVSYNTNNGTCVFDTSKSYTLTSPETATTFTATYNVYPAVKIYWFDDTKTMYWDMVDPTPSSIPCIKSEYGSDYGAEGKAYAFKAKDYNPEVLVFGEGFTNISYSREFMNYTTVKKIVFPSTLVSTESSSFKGCTALETVDLSRISGSFDIGSYTFANCSSLKSCVLPNTTRMISHGAFEECYNLETIGEGLPPNLEMLGSFTFSGCPNLVLNTTLPDSLAYFYSLNGGYGMNYNNVTVTGTLPANLKTFCCVWNNARMHFAGLTKVKLRGDIPAGTEKIGENMFSIYQNKDIEEQSYFDRNLSNVVIGEGMNIPVKYIIEDRKGSATGELLGSNEYLGYAGKEYSISDSMTKWNETETISYEGYSVKDNSAKIIPVIDKEGTVAKAVRVWEENEKYFYLKVFRNGIAKDLESEITLVDSSEEHPLSLSAEYIDNGIYKVAFEPSELTVPYYKYRLKIYVGGTEARKLYNRRLFYGSYNKGAGVTINGIDAWYDACYFAHLDGITDSYTYGIEEITNARKMSEINLDVIKSIDFNESYNGYTVNYFRLCEGNLSPIENNYYYIDYQDWAFMIDANTGKFSDGTNKKYVQFSGNPDSAVYTEGKPEEPKKNGYIFADWEANTANHPIIPDWYGAGQTSEEVVSKVSTPYDGNTHDIALSKISDHLEDMAYKHYVDSSSDGCSATHISTRYAKYRPIITFDANGGTYPNGETVIESTIRSGSSYFNYVISPAYPTREGHTFYGYSPSNSFVNGSSAFSDINSTPRNYKAYWVINTVYISFYQDGGSYVSSQSINWNTKATKPTDPTRTGYTFMGWYTDKTYTVPVDWENDVYKEHKTLYPLYMKNPCIRFNTNGGSTVANQYVEYMGKAEKPTTPTKNGYTFDKWYKNTALTTEYDFDTALTEDLTLYAGWDAKTYSITYDYGGGSVSSINKASYKPTDTSFVLIDAVKPHYYFRGYTVTNDESEGFSISSPRGNLTIPKGTYGNLTVKAEYSEIPQYTVTFNLDYEGSTPYTVKAYSGEVLEQPEDPEREGYYFKCWKDDYGSERSSIRDTVFSNMTYTAKWIKKYAITFDANGGTYEDGTSQITLYTNKEGKVSYIPQPKKTARIFTGSWGSSPEASTGVSYSTNTNFGMWDDDMTLYAIYGRRTYSINYVLNGGKTETPLYTLYDGSVEFSFPDDVEKEGYYFIGWTIENDGAEGSTFSVDLPEKGIVVGKDTYGNLIVRAHYVKKCDITLNANGGEFSDGSDIKHVYTDEDGRIVIAEVPEREGHTFKCWEIDGKEYNPETDVFTDDGELTAKWEINKVTISFISGTDVVVSKVYNYGEAVKAPSVSKEGHTFTGWNPIFAPVAKKDTTYTANFRVNTYRIKFIDHNGNIISNKTYTYGAKIDIPDGPARTGYMFKGYSPEVSSVCKGNAEYKATYSIMTYTVQFVDYDGRQISKAAYTYGDMVNEPASPSRSGYIFSGWDKAVSRIVTADSLYKAVYNQISVKYTVTFIDQNGYIINSREYSKGDIIYIPEAPERKGYEFSGWKPNVVKNCEGTATYRATYEKEEQEPEVKTYLITFAGYNGQIVSSASYKEGEVISIPNAPEVDGYNFRNWYPAVEAKATKSVTYTAVYDAKPTPIEDPKPKKEKEEEEIEPEEEGETEEEKPSDNEKPDEIPKKEKFTVVFKDSDGKVISRKVYEEGDDIEIPNAPKKYGYTFNGWSPKVDKKAAKNTEYKAIYTKIEIKEPVKDEPKPEKKTISPVVKPLIAGAACIGILTAGYFSGVWLLLLNLLFIGKRKKWRGILTEDDNKYIKTVKNLDDKEASISALFEDMAGDINLFMDSVGILKSYTVLPFGTKMFVTLSNSKGTDVRNYDNASEDAFYEVLLENLSQDTRVILNLVNERCDVNIEIEFSITEKDNEIKTSVEPENKTARWKEESDGDLEFLDEDDIPDYS